MKKLFARKFFQLPKAEIGYLRFLLESYDGLAFFRTLDGSAGLIELAYPAGRATDVEELLGSLADELPMVETPVPPGLLPPW